LSGPRISDVAFELATKISYVALRSIMQGFGRFVAAQGDMRSELWVCGLAHTDHRCGVGVFIEITDCQQLRLLVRGRRLHHARGHEALVGLQGRSNSSVAQIVLRLRNPARPDAASVGAMRLRHVGEATDAAMSDHGTRIDPSFNRCWRPRLPPHTCWRSVRIGSHTALASS